MFGPKTESSLILPRALFSHNVANTHNYCNATKNLLKYKKVTASLMFQRLSQANLPNARYKRGKNETMKTKFLG